MFEAWKQEKCVPGFWHSGKVTRLRLIGYSVAGAGALGAAMLVPAPWRAAFGQAKAYKIGSLQPLSGTAAAGGKTALVGVQTGRDLDAISTRRASRSVHDESTSWTNEYAISAYESNNRSAPLIARAAAPAL